MFLNVSLGRLWWTVGPMSCTALIPVLGPLQRAGGQIASAAKGATAALVVGAAGLLPMVNGTAAASTHATSGSASTGTSVASSDHSVVDDDVRSGGIGSTAGAGEHHDVPGDEQTGSGGGPLRRGDRGRFRGGPFGRRASGRR